MKPSGGPATPAGAFCALRRGGGASSSMGGGGGESAGTPAGGLFVPTSSLSGGSPIKGGAASRARAGPPAVSLVAGSQYCVPVAPAFPGAGVATTAAPAASPLSARSALMGGGGWVADVDGAAAATDPPSPSHRAAAAAQINDITGARVAAAAAALAARLGAPGGAPSGIDFATVYAFVGSLFDEACAGVDHAAVLQEVRKIRVRAQARGPQHLHPTAPLSPPKPTLFPPTFQQLAPLNRAACVACLRCVSEFLRCPDSLAAVERDIAAAAAADEAVGRGAWAAP
jgi:hypothetical protein